ncbi:hypothetical protein ACC745_38870, partial [Rhizobium ruizarguesonis]
SGFRAWKPATAEVTMTMRNGLKVEASNPEWNAVIDLDRPGMLEAVGELVDSELGPQTSASIYNYIPK